MTAKQILNKYWGYSEFRPFQEEIIQSLIDLNDTLVLLPTGGGKSLCFQVPALMTEGICIVVSPLISLIQDQVSQLRLLHINAQAVYAGMPKSKIDIVLDNCIYGDVKFLYVSPERLASTLFRERAKQMKVNFLAIDEAHCISKWGYDFRPSYQKIALFNSEILNNRPIIALTASAGKKVLDDIVLHLKMRNPEIFKQSFARENLSYSVYLEENKEKKIFSVLNNVPGSSIIYVNSRNKTKTIADWLNKNNISATNYHAGLTFKERENNQTEWLKNQKRVIVATNAFGMGIDKPDVRSVIHLDLPENLEAYYQEAGRAGRDRKKAYAVVIYAKSDLRILLTNVEKKYPKTAFISSVYEALANYFQQANDTVDDNGFELNIHDFVDKFSLSHYQTHFALKILQYQGLIHLSGNTANTSTLILLVDNLQMYNFQLKNPYFELIIKTILRMYGGELFSIETAISEVQIAKNCMLSATEITNGLKALEQQGLLSYKQTSNNNVLFFTPKRFEINKLPLREQEIATRKQNDKTNAEGIKNYITHPFQCRFILIANYFDEYTEKYCGICDNCLKNKKQALLLSDAKSEEKKHIILKILTSEACSLENVFEACQPIDKTNFVTIIQSMLGLSLIKINSSGQLCMF